VRTEDAVIGALCEHLAAEGWTIVSRAMPSQRGTDVVATRAGIRLEVEAKRAGSSKPHTARYGRPFDQAQVRVHVGPRGTTERKVPARSDRCGQYRCSGRSTGRDRCLAPVPPDISRMNMSAVIRLVDLQKLRVAPLTVPLFLEGRSERSAAQGS
jgi:hypothetical protein